MFRFLYTFFDLCLLQYFRMHKYFVVLLCLFLLSVFDITLSQSLHVFSWNSCSKFWCLDCTVLLGKPFIKFVCFLVAIIAHKFECCFVLLHRCIVCFNYCVNLWSYHGSISLGKKTQVLFKVLRFAQILFGKRWGNLNL